MELKKEDSAALKIIKQAEEIGLTPKEIARICGVHTTTVAGWHDKPGRASFDRLNRLYQYVTDPNRILLKHATLEMVLNHLADKWPDIKRFKLPE